MNPHWATRNAAHVAARFGRVRARRRPRLCRALALRRRRPLLGPYRLPCMIASAGVTRSKRRRRDGEVRLGVMEPRLLAPPASLRAGRARGARAARRGRWLDRAGPPISAGTPGARTWQLAVHQGTLRRSCRHLAETGRRSPPLRLLVQGCRGMTQGPRQLQCPRPTVSYLWTRSMLRHHRAGATHCLQFAVLVPCGSCRPHLDWTELRRCL